MPYKNPANATGLCPLGLCPPDNFCLAGYCYSEPDPSEAVGPCDFEREQICPDHHYCHVNQCYITPRTWPEGYVDYSGTVFAWSTAPVNGTCTYPYILYRGSCVISLLMPEKDSADSAGTCVDTCSLADHYCLDGYCYPEPEPELSAGPCVPGIIDCPQHNYECISGGCYIKAPVY